MFEIIGKNIVTKIKFFLFVVLIGSISSVALGIVSAPDWGICFGKCANKRETQFRYFFEDWYLSQFKCGPQSNDRESIQFVFPRMIDRLDEANRSFALLAQSELNGSLSISDRDNYLKSDLRVIVYDDRELSEFPYREEVSYEKMPTWVRECEQLGVVGQNYCEGYAVIPVMPEPEPRSAILRVINSTPSKEVQVEEFYDRLVASGEIDKFNDMILESVLGRNKLLQQAEAEVARMPTSAFVDPNDELYDRQVKGAILKRHHELLCKR